MKYRNKPHISLNDLWVEGSWQPKYRCYFDGYTRYANSIREVWNDFKMYFPHRDDIAKYGKG